MNWHGCLRRLAVLEWDVQKVHSIFANVGGFRGAGRAGKSHMTNQLTSRQSRDCALETE